MSNIVVMVDIRVNIKVDIVVYVLMDIMVHVVVNVLAVIVMHILVVIVMNVLVVIVVVGFFDLSVVMDGLCLNWHVNVLGLVCHWFVISVMSRFPNWNPFNVSLSVFNWLVLGLTRVVLVLWLWREVMRHLVAMLFLKVALGSFMLWVVVAIKFVRFYVFLMVVVVMMGQNMNVTMLVIVVVVIMVHINMHIAMLPIFVMAISIMVFVMGYGLSMAVLSVLIMVRCLVAKLRCCKPMSVVMSLVFMRLLVEVTFLMVELFREWVCEGRRSQDSCCEDGSHIYLDLIL